MTAAASFVLLLAPSVRTAAAPVPQQASARRYAGMTSCLAEVQWYSGIEVHDWHGAAGGTDLTNRGGITASQCAAWCCAVDACVAFFHTKNQLSAASNCSARQPCCWLKPTFNSSRLGSYCSPRSNCMSGVRWAIKPNPMFTRFAADVSPTMATPYPRPQLTRGAGSWASLNGLWFLTAQPGINELPDEPPIRVGQQQILVPFPVEAALSGVRTSTSDFYGLGPRWNSSAPYVFWYSRRISSSVIPAAPQPQQLARSPFAGTGRLFLHFEAVMARTVVFLNGKQLGKSHFGGYDDFSFEVLPGILRDEGENLLQVGVLNDAWFHGKQFNKHFLEPGGISYSPSSGIWQSVRLCFPQPPFIVLLIDNLAFLLVAPLPRRYGWNECQQQSRSRLSWVVPTLIYPDSPLTSRLTGPQRWDLLLVAA